MDEILKLIKEYSKYNIDNYQYYDYSEFINLPEYIMILGLVIYIKDYGVKINDKDLYNLLYNNRNELVHHNDINKYGNENHIKNKIYKIIKLIINYIIANY